jgi:hypothetical protein
VVGVTTGDNGRQGFLIVRRQFGGRNCHVLELADRLQVLLQAEELRGCAAKQILNILFR